MEIKWESPAARRRVGRRGFMKEFTAELAKRPNEWALYPGRLTTTQSVKSRAAQLRADKRYREFDFVAAGKKLYARYGARP